VGTFRNKSTKVIAYHLTSVHYRFDTRIFHRQCTSLATSFYIGLVVCDGCGDETINNVSIIDLGKPKNRYSRMIVYPLKLLGFALKNRAEIYHIHDPELIPIGLILRLLQKTVIYDAHEDIAAQVFHKDYIPKPFRHLVSYTLTALLFLSFRFFTQLITVTPHIQQSLKKLNKTDIIYNYPIIDEFKTSAHLNNQVCYVGVISFYRCLKEINAAIQQTSGKLVFGGKYCTKEEGKFISKLDKKKSNYLGFLNRNQINSLFNESKAGLMIEYDMPNHVNGYPVKLFEYMSAGLPVIISNFPLWMEIINKHQCGIGVDPFNIDEIAKAIQWVFDNPKEAKKMGHRGAMAAQKYFNWANEEKKLFNIYEQYV